MSGHIIDPMLFYWLDVVEEINILSAVLLVAFLIVGVILCILFLADLDFNGGDMDDPEVKRWIRPVKCVAVAFLASCIVSVLCPSKETLLTMQISQFATYENAELTLDTIKSAVDYIVEAMK